MRRVPALEGRQKLRAEVLLFLRDLDGFVQGPFVPGLEALGYDLSSLRD